MSEKDQHDSVTLVLQIFGSFIKYIVLEVITTEICYIWHYSLEVGKLPV